MARKSSSILILWLTLWLAANSSELNSALAKRHQDGGSSAPANAQASSELPELNSKVLQFVLANQGKQVGNGECWTLAAAALDSAGASPPDGYAFGRELGSKEAWLPGDIMQFKSCHFEEQTPTSWSEFDLGWPNHTAIIYKNEDGKTTLLHQNFAQNRTVQSLTINMGNLKSGSFKVFRPIASDSNRSSSERHNRFASGFQSRQNYTGTEGFPPVAPSFDSQNNPTGSTGSAVGFTPGENSAPLNYGQPAMGGPAMGGPATDPNGISQDMPGSFNGQPSNGEARPRHHWRPRLGEQQDGGTTDGALGENIQIAEGPFYQERSQLLEKIRQLQMNGDNARFPLQLLQRIEQTCKQAQQSFGGAEGISAELRGQIAQLNQIINTRAANQQHHMQP